ncbi:hypothetical protein THIBAULT_54 [Mycobacterium phage Thibault]|uniref:Uncharacterized protein n=1 Tax=Mycobacterium phage Thibault TaxID=1052673 RepID=G1FGB9_9CAUD|nr:hypothetical protein CL87_gp054 [Mycobacterium phage Thibault]AEJ94154.1 hypothetical protein THIBAULT_54 [Mycobacterium phage Thibault]
MNEYTVWFAQAVGTVVKRVEAEDYSEAIDRAWDELPGSLCHQCARDFDLAGEWEPDAVEDAEGNIVWEEKRR